MSAKVTCRHQRDNQPLPLRASSAEVGVLEQDITTSSRMASIGPG